MSYLAAWNVSNHFGWKVDENTLRIRCSFHQIITCIRNSLNHSSTPSWMLHWSCHMQTFLFHQISLYHLKPFPLVGRLALILKFSFLRLFYWQWLILLRKDYLHSFCTSIYTCEIILQFSYLYKMPCKLYSI